MMLLFKTHELILIMNDTLSNLNLEIKKGISSAKTLEELYQLLSTYNAYNILLIKAKIN